LDALVTLSKYIYGMSMSSGEPTTVVLAIGSLPRPKSRLQPLVADTSRQRHHVAIKQIEPPPDERATYRKSARELRS